MMKKKWDIRLLLLGIWLVVQSCTLSGCNRDEEKFFFSEEITVQEEGMAVEAEGSENLIPEVTMSETDLFEDVAGKEEIVVYVCGAVKIPGVITLPKGSRMNDAVQAAGGFTEDAAYNSVNLAAKLIDEEMIYVLTEEEVKAQSAAESAGSNEDADGLVNINTADLYTLCSLPGIGESKAREIVAYREKKGAFRKKEDIMQVTGIKESLYRKISDLISVK